MSRMRILINERIFNSVGIYNHCLWSIGSVPDTFPPARLFNFQRRRESKKKYETIYFYEIFLHKCFFYLSFILYFCRAEIVDTSKMVSYRFHNASSSSLHSDSNSLLRVTGR